MIGAVSKLIPVGTIELSDEFFPAHLSVALIDAVFRSHLRDDEQPAPSANRYCRYFEIAMTRPNRWNRPPSDAQETLGDLTGRYFELGVNGMTNKVFQTRCRFPGTETTRTEYVLRVANELRRIGIEVLQDVSVRRTREIEDALQTVPGLDRHMVRMLLMYAGGDDFVCGDDRVRRFVASAISRSSVSGSRAVNLVRHSAYEMILSPRYLDHQIWKHSVSIAPCAVRRNRQRSGSRDSRS